MKIRPLTGQVLVKMLPEESQSWGGIMLPPGRNDGWRGTVVAMGPWKQTKDGLQELPPFGVGSTVILSPYLGQELHRDIGERLRLVKSTDVLAVEISEKGC